MAKAKFKQVLARFRFPLIVFFKPLRTGKLPISSDALLDDCFLKSSTTLPN